MDYVDGRKAYFQLVSAPGQHGKTECSIQSSLRLYPDPRRPRGTAGRHRYAHAEAPSYTGAAFTGVRITAWEGAWRGRSCRAVGQAATRPSNHTVFAIERNDEKHDCSSDPHSLRSPANTRTGQALTVDAVRRVSFPRHPEAKKNAVKKEAGRCPITLF